MKLCGKCGKQLDDATKFCSGCGSNVAGAPVVAAPNQGPASNQGAVPNQGATPNSGGYAPMGDMNPSGQASMGGVKSAKKNNKMLIILIAAVAAVVVLIVAGIGGYFIYDSTMGYKTPINNMIKANNNGDAAAYVKAVTNNGSYTKEDLYKDCEDWYGEEVEDADEFEDCFYDNFQYIEEGTYEFTIIDTEKIDKDDLKDDLQDDFYMSSSQARKASKAVIVEYEVEFEDIYGDDYEYEGEMVVVKEGGKWYLP